MGDSIRHAWRERNRRSQTDSNLDRPQIEIVSNIRYPSLFETEASFPFSVTDRANAVTGRTLITLLPGKDSVAHRSAASGNDACMQSSRADTGIICIDTTAPNFSDHTIGSAVAGLRFTDLSALGDGICRTGICDCNRQIPACQDFLIDGASYKCTYFHQLYPGCQGECGYRQFHPLCNCQYRSQEIHS